MAKGLAKPAAGESAPAATRAEPAKDTKNLKDMFMRSVDGFSWIYVALLAIAVGAVLIMSIGAYFDLERMRRYDPAPLSDSPLMLFKDSIEYQILWLSPKFTAFTEGPRALSIGLGVGINVLVVLVIHMVLAIIFAINRELPGMSGVGWSVYKDGELTNMAIPLAVGVTYYVALILYKFVIFDKFKNELVNGLFKERKLAVTKFDTYIVKNVLYDSGDAGTFFATQRIAHLDNASTLMDYIIEKKSTTAPPQIAKMIATFNLFNYFRSYFNTEDNFTKSDIYERFNPENYTNSEVRFSDQVPILLQNAGGDTIRNMLTETDGIIHTIAEEMGDDVTTKVNEIMVELNTRFKNAFQGFDWTRKEGRPSEIYNAFYGYIFKRCAYLLSIAVPIFFVIAMGIVWGMNKAWAYAHEKVKERKEMRETVKATRADGS